MNKTINKLFIVGFLLICSSSLNATCSENEKQRMLDSGFSKARIDSICGSSSRTQKLSNICKTESMWCKLRKSGPIGTPCWCVSSDGPQSGYLIQKNH